MQERKAYTCLLNMPTEYTESLPALDCPQGATWCNSKFRLNTLISDIWLVVKALHVYLREAFSRVLYGNLENCY